MEYQETIDYLYTHLPMYHRIGAAAFKKDLTNTLALLEILDNPHKKIETIHVAGTNGKGSVSNMLASVLTEAGFKTGLYTSPHLLDFKERIRINGVLCDKKFVIDFVEKMKPHIATIQPSFFEITVAMAFAYFAEQDVDIAIIEVGLGGRLDSTNVITPLLSIITNISLDHQFMLGDTLPEIASEKAGIIKTHVPVVIGEFHEETFPVFIQKANSVSSDLYLAEENVKVDVLVQQVDYIECNVSFLNQLIYPNLILGLTGNYQIKNVSTVIQAIEILRKYGTEISEESIYEGLKKVQQNTGFAGRWQVIQKDPLIVFDCAHNSAGLEVLFKQVKDLTFNKLHIITGAVNDKDISANLNAFPQDAIYYFCKPNIPRGLAAEELREKALELNLLGKSYVSVEDAMQNAIPNLHLDDLLLICGSIFVVAEALLHIEMITNKR